jgi:hypothetical protein
LLRLSSLVILLAGAVSLSGLAGCAAVDVSGEVSSAQTYTVTVTSAAESLSQSTNVTLIVE